MPREGLKLSFVQVRAPLYACACCETVQIISSTLAMEEQNVLDQIRGGGGGANILCCTWNVKESMLSAPSNTGSPLWGGALVLRTHLMPRLQSQNDCMQHTEAT